MLYISYRFIVKKLIKWWQDWRDEY
jgi:hypothetical protein